MKPTTPLLVLSLGATTALARTRNTTDPSSPSSQCHRLARLTSLAALASDPAALAAKSQADATEIQAKAAAAAPELAALRGNETFIALCAAQVNGTTTGTGGGWGGWDDCKKLENLREKVALGVNATTATEGAPGGAGELRRGAKWAEKLKELEGNETLVAECAAKAGGGGGASGGSGGGVASPTGSSGSTETTGSTKPPPSDTTIISGVSGSLELVGNTLGWLGVVLFGALLL